MLSSPRRKGLALLVSLALAGLGVLGYFTLVKAPGDVERGNSVEFETAQPEPKAKPKRKGRKFRWTVYGYDDQHTRYLPSKLRPPFRVRWRYSAKSTVEISPLLIDGTLYATNKHATLTALRARDGKRKWKKYLGSLSASTPAYSKGRLFVTTLSRQAYAVNPRNKGAIYWKKRLPSRSESSPIVVGRRVIFGSEDGTVYALGTLKGGEKWRFRASGAVKGAVAHWRGRLYFATYGGRVYCIRARTGKLIWMKSTAGLALGRGGNFYATPTVAFGRVYIGNTDGKVYSFSARTGKVAWTHTTGNYVYAATAAADTPKTRPTIYVGSYDQNFYALDARTGRVKWRFPAGSPISGAPTVIGSVVYFSTLRTNRTFGLDIRNGRKVFTFKRGDYNPAIADDRGNLYLTAVNRIYRLTPKKRPKRR